MAFRVQASGAGVARSAGLDQAVFKGLSLSPTSLNTVLGDIKGKPNPEAYLPHLFSKLDALLQPAQPPAPDPLTQFTPAMLITQLRSIFTGKPLVDQVNGIFGASKTAHRLNAVLMATVLTDSAPNTLRNVITKLEVKTDVEGILNNATCVQVFKELGTFQAIETTLAALPVNDANTKFQNDLRALLYSKKENFSTTVIDPLSLLGWPAGVATAGNRLNLMFPAPPVPPAPAPADSLTAGVQFGSDKATSLVVMGVVRELDALVDSKDALPVAGTQRILNDIYNACNSVPPRLHASVLPSAVKLAMKLGTPDSYTTACKMAMVFYDQSEVNKTQLMTEIASRLTTSAQAGTFLNILHSSYPERASKIDFIRILNVKDTELLTHSPADRHTVLEHTAVTVDGHSTSFSTYVEGLQVASRKSQDWVTSENRKLSLKLGKSKYDTRPSTPKNPESISDKAYLDLLDVQAATHHSRSSKISEIVAPLFDRLQTLEETFSAFLENMKSGKSKDALAQIPDMTTFWQALRIDFQDRAKLKIVATRYLPTVARRIDAISWAVQQLRGHFSSSPLLISTKVLLTEGVRRAVSDSVATSQKFQNDYCQNITPHKSAKSSLRGQLNTIEDGYQDALTRLKGDDALPLLDFQQKLYDQEAKFNADASRLIGRLKRNHGAKRFRAEVNARINTIRREITRLITAIRDVATVIPAALGAPAPAYAVLAPFNAVMNAFPAPAPAPAPAAAAPPAAPAAPTSFDATLHQYAESGDVSFGTVLKEADCDALLAFIALGAPFAVKTPLQKQAFLAVFLGNLAATLDSYFIKPESVTSNLCTTKRMEFLSKALDILNHLNVRGVLAKSQSVGSSVLSGHAARVRGYVGALQQLQLPSALFDQAKANSVLTALNGHQADPSIENTVAMKGDKGVLSDGPAYLRDQRTWFATISTQLATLDRFYELSGELLPDAVDALRTRVQEYASTLEGITKPSEKRPATYMRAASPSQPVTLSEVSIKFEVKNQLDALRAQVEGLNVAPAVAPAAGAPPTLLYTLIQALDAKPSLQPNSLLTQCTTLSANPSLTSSQRAQLREIMVVLNSAGVVPDSKVRMDLFGRLEAIEKALSSPTQSANVVVFMGTCMGLIRNAEGALLLNPQPSALNPLEAHFESNKALLNQLSFDQLMSLATDIHTLTIPQAHQAVFGPIKNALTASLNPILNSKLKVQQTLSASVSASQKATADGLFSEMATALTQLSQHRSEMARYQMVFGDTKELTTFATELSKAERALCHAVAVRYQGLLRDASPTLPLFSSSLPSEQGLAKLYNDVIMSLMDGVGTRNPADATSVTVTQGTTAERKAALQLYADRVADLAKSTPFEATARFASLESFKWLSLNFGAQLVDNQPYINGRLITLFKDAKTNPKLKAQLMHYLDGLTGPERAQLITNALNGCDLGQLARYGGDFSDPVPPVAAAPAAATSDRVMRIMLGMVPVLEGYASDQAAAAAAAAAVPPVAPPVLRAYQLIFTDNLPAVMGVIHPVRDIVTGGIGAYLVTFNGLPANDQTTAMVQLLQYDQANNTQFSTEVLRRILNPAAPAALTPAQLVGSLMTVLGGLTNLQLIPMALNYASELFLKPPIPPAAFDAAELRGAVLPLLQNNAFLTLVNTDPQCKQALGSFLAAVSQYTSIASIFNGDPAAPAALTPPDALLWDCLGISDAPHALAPPPPPSTSEEKAARFLDKLFDNLFASASTPQQAHVQACIALEKAGCGPLQYSTKKADFDRALPVTWPNSVAADYISRVNPNPFLTNPLDTPIHEWMHSNPSHLAEFFAVPGVMEKFAAYNQANLHLHLAYPHVRDAMIEGLKAIRRADYALYTTIKTTLLVNLFAPPAPPGAPGAVYVAPVITVVDDSGSDILDKLEIVLSARQALLAPAHPRDIVLMSRLVTSVASELGLTSFLASVVPNPQPVPAQPAPTMNDLFPIVPPPAPALTFANCKAISNIILRLERGVGVNDRLLTLTGLTPAQLRGLIRQNPTWGSQLTIT